MSVNRHCFCRACLLVWLVTGICIRASGASITWTNIAGGTWSNTNNWSPNQVPGAADTALITASGTYAITLNVNAQVAALTLGAVTGTQKLTVNSSTLSMTDGGMVGANGILTLAGSTLTANLTVNGTLNWTNGMNLSSGSTVTIATNAVLNISGTSNESLYGTLTNAGTVNWAGTGYLQLYFSIPSGYDGGIVNLPGALFNAQNDETINNAVGSPNFYNAGTFLKSAGTNTTLNVLFTNVGVLNLASGTVTINGGGADSGTNTGVGSITSTGGNFVLSSTVPNLVLAGGTVTGMNTTVTNLTWNSGTLQGPGTTVATLASWTSGTINNGSSLTIASNAVLNISGTASKSLFGTLTNAGTVNWAGTGYLQLYFSIPSGYDGAIVNLPGALFNAQNDETINNAVGSPNFYNGGTFLKSAGTNTTLNVLFTNVGTLDVASGTVTINGGGADSGTNTGAGSITSTGGNFVLSSTVPNLVLAGGTITGMNTTVTNLTWNGGTLQGPGTTVATLASWTSGTLNNGSSLTIATNAVLNINGTSSESLFGTLTNAGTVNWTGTGYLQLYFSIPSGYDGAIVNLPGALFNAQNDEKINNAVGSPYFLNSGTFLKSAGTNTTLNVLFTNVGVLNLASGTVTINGGGADSGTNTGAGSITSTGGNFVLSSTVPNLVLAGGTITGMNTTVTNLTWNGGTLQGPGTTVATFSSWTSGTLNNGSSLTIASNAVLNISGTSGESLYGTLNNAGTVNWGGTGFLQLYFSISSSYDGGIVNLPGALFNAQNDETINDAVGSPYFYNAGTFLKSAGTNTTINVLFTNTGTLDLAIYSRNSYGRINFNGNVPLAGVLNLNFTNTYLPATGDSFTFLTYGSEAGVFSAVNLSAPTAFWQTNSLTYGSTAFTLTIGSLYKLAFLSGPPVTNTAGATFAPVVVQAEYQNGTAFPTNGVPVTIALTNGTGILSGTLTRNTDASGKATFNDLSINLVGPKTLYVASPPWISPTNAALVIVSAPPSQLVITQPIAALQKLGYPFSPAPAIQVLDQFGNIVSNAIILVTANSTSSGGGSLGGTTVVNANGTNGLATFGSLHYALGNPSQAEAVSVYFTSPGLTPATNPPVLVDFPTGLITLTNGNSVVQIDPNSLGGVYAWVVDGINQLYQQWFWLGQPTNGPQVSFDQLGTPLGTTVTSSNAMFIYLPKGLEVTLSFTLEGGTTGSQTSTLSESISVQNTTNVPVSMHVYDYADFDLAGNEDGDSLSFPTTNSVVQQGKGMVATQWASPAPNYWEGSWYALTLDTLLEPEPAILSDDIEPNEPGDQTFGYQWNLALGAGQAIVLNLTNTIQMPSVLLAIMPAGTNAIVSWPTNGTGGFALQSNANLSGGNVWQNVTNTPATVGANYEVIIPVTGSARFYRLRQ